MKVIDIQEKNTDAFCRDVVSVTTNYKALLRKPERKINDTIRSYRVLLCMDVILLVMFGADFIRGERAALLIVALAFAILSLVLLLATYPGIMKLYKTLLADSNPSQLILDENGVELRKGDSKSVRLGWDHIAFVRAFKSSVCFLDSDATGFILAVSTTYKDEIAEYLTENQIQIMKEGL